MNDNKDFNEKNFQKIVKRQRRKNKRKLRNQRLKQKFVSIRTKIIFLTKRAGKGTVFVIKFCFQKETIVTIVIATNTWSYRRESQRLGNEISEQRVEIVKLQKQVAKKQSQSIIERIQPRDWLSIGFLGYSLVNKVYMGLKQTQTVNEMAKLYANINAGKQYIQKIENALEEQKIELNAEREKTNSLKQELNDKISSEKTLLSEIQELKKNIEKKEQFLKKQESELNRKSSEIESLETKEKTIVSSLSNRTKNILRKYGLNEEVSAENVIQALDLEIAQVNQELENMKIQVKNLTQQSDEKDTTINQLKRVIEINDEKINDVKLRLKETESELKKKNENHSKLEKEIIYLQGVLRAFNDERRKALESSALLRNQRQRIEELNDLNNQQFVQISNLKRDLNRLRASKGETENRVSEIAQQRNKYLNETNHYQKILQEQNHQLQKLRNLLKEETLKYENLQSENTKLKNRVSYLEKTLSQKDSAHQSVVDQAQFERTLFEKAEQNRNKRPKKPPYRVPTGFDGQCTPMGHFGSSLKDAPMKWEDKPPSPKLTFWDKLKKSITIN